MNRILIKRACLIVCVAAAIFWTSPVFATEIYIPALKANPGQMVEIPVMIDHVENLAGVKLIVEYDCKILTFKKGEKTKESNSLMHIVNDKKPGRLIIVMAGAKGIKGKNFPILTLAFEIKKGLTGNHAISIKITDVQLMSDKLKEIKCGIMVNPLSVSH
ncbi:MAG: hypothetical protein SRB1_02511 [Desulfobacteraceae bacterium Eth-SRB1]|nr:MAG: hypothetical protein SRB1_02511 [Desulfobacteraceae bacterium Eth-SRB1]